MSQHRFEVRLGGLGVLIGIAVITVGLMAVTTRDEIVIEDFGVFEHGFVVAGELPGGAVSAGETFPDFQLSVANHGHGPHTLAVFDSSLPGDDLDLGTPNATCGGPGVGQGGVLGAAGENCMPLGNLLVIAGDLVDADSPRGVLDDPDDEPGGGMIIFDFYDPVIVESLTLVDLDDGQPAILDLYGAGGLLGSVTTPTLGDNSVLHVDLSEFHEVERLQLQLVGSGGIGRIEYRRPLTPANLIAWSRVKEIFRL
jgi:hypothetical protein